MWQVEPVGSNQQQSRDSSSRVTFNPAVTGAVAALNASSYFGAGREVTYSFSRAAHLPVVRVIDTSTKEVIVQLPSEFVLRLAAGPTTDQT